MTARRSPEGGCPICGVPYRASGNSKHRCSDRALAAINGADTAAWESDGRADPMRRCVAERIDTGAMLLAHDNMGPDEEDPWRFPF